MGKKKPFINKKNSATFHLLARDTSASDVAAGAPESDRVFVRVDNNPYSVRGLEDDDEVDGGELNEEFGQDSIFADAPEDADDVRDWISGGGGGGHGESRGAMPDHVRREIIELGFPDDGYNYLLHLREIKNAGGGSTYYHNSKAKLDQLPLDVKAYDASRVQISGNTTSELNNDSHSFHNVTSKTVGVKVQRVIDPDVARLLDDSDLSRFGSDVEDLDEDFVVKANLADGEEDEKVVVEGKGAASFERDAFEGEDNKFANADGDDELEVSAKPRIRRLLDEQFDLLTLREYDDDSDDSDACYMGNDDGPLAAKISDALKPYGMNNLQLEHKYRVPADLEHDNEGSDVGVEVVSSDVIQKCVEYAEKYCNESQDDKEVVLVEESSEESEVWDCETIVSTYSNLDNHPGKIQAPGNPKRRVPKHFPGDSALSGNVIALGGKAKLPIEFLPQSRRPVEKAKAAVKSSGTDRQKRRPGEESKEEKKVRKATVKEERREARRTKKELKSLYKCEAQKAQKVAAIAGPSSVHLM